ncbi:hypothetical protein H0H87_004503 [Tephrocybe sp. NHM501043]|nr:hypothetical protein H0H87_004503 [Tephrocybe sp. NHM501043]
MHPRHSVLNLFDPLAYPEPLRDAPSPDSDKENSSPPVVSDLSFFGRVSKQQSPVRIKRRLIDVGDITTDDPSMLSMLTEEEELENSMCDDENDTFTLPRLELPTGTPVRAVFAQPATPSNTSPRTPLGDISLARDITPVARTKMYRRPPAPSALAAENSSFSSVIDAVTASGASFACSASSSPEPDDSKDEAYLPNDVIEAPRITVTSVEELSNSMSILSLEDPSATSLEDNSQSITPSSLSEPSDTSVEYSRGTLRPNPPNTSSHDPNRQSIDLQLSFQLQLQSAEASFDLLNDKISFFGPLSGMDSFLNGMEDTSFDMVVEKSKLQKTLESIEQNEDERNDQNIPEEAPGMLTPSKQHGDNEITNYSPNGIDVDTLDQELDIEAQTSSPTSSTDIRVTGPKILRRSSLRATPSSPISFTFSEAKAQPGETAIAAPVIIPEPTANDSFKTPAPVFVPPTPNENPEPTICTPVHVHTPGLPPPVPALRIVKRPARPGHEKSASSSSVSSSASEGLAAVQPNNLASSSTVATSALPPVRRQVPSLVAATKRIVNNRSVVPAPSAILVPTAAVTGPRRVPIFDNQSQPANRQRGIAGQRTVPQGSTSGPRRLVASTSSVSEAVAPVPKAPAVSGIKAPTKYGAMGSGAAVSALPRPVSRLPSSTASLARPRPITGTNIGMRGVPGLGPGNIKRTAPTRRGVE